MKKALLSVMALVALMTTAYAAGCGKCTKLGCKDLETWQHCNENCRDSEEGNMKACDAAHKKAAKDTEDKKKAEDEINNDADEAVKKVEKKADKDADSDSE